jgi:hypothetical protein
MVYLKQAAQLRTRRLPSCRLRRERGTERELGSWLFPDTAGGG